MSNQKWIARKERFVEDIGEETFVTEKRLTDSDLDDAFGYLSIPEPAFNIALQFLSRNEKRLMEGNRPVHASMVDFLGIQPVVKSLLLSKSSASYRLSGEWNLVRRANEEKFKGVNGLSAVIQLYCSRPRSRIRFALKLKQPEVLDGLKTRLQFMLYASEPVLFAEKRLTDCDLRQDSKGLVIGLSLPENVFRNSILFTATEGRHLEGRLSVKVMLLQYIDNVRVQTHMEIMKTRGKSYILTGNWNFVFKRNKKKFIGVNGLHAVIQLWFFRYDGSRLCFALDIAEEAKADAEAFLRGKEVFVKATFITQKRLTDSDLDEEKGCLSISEDDFKNALPFLSTSKMEEIESGRSVPATFYEFNGVKQQKVNTNMLLSKSETSYEFTGAWNDIKRANEEKFRGVDGLHAVIQLHCYLVGEEIQFMLVKEPEIPERLNKFVESMQGASKPKFLTQKRLSESDLDQSEGRLLIPDGFIDKANLLDLGEPLEVRLICINDDHHFGNKAKLIRKPNKDFALTKKWKNFIRRHAKKLMGIDGSRAVIQLWFFRDRSLELYFALYIAEEAYCGDAAEASTSHGSGSSNIETVGADA